MKLEASCKHLGAFKLDGELQKWEALEQKFWWGEEATKFGEGNKWLWEVNLTKTY